jgi:hypothetical protein
MTNYIFAANVTYCGLTYNTKLLFEYQHTGGYYFINTSNGKHILSGEESANNKIKQGKKVYYSNGYYFIKRMAILNINTKSKPDFWYIDTNDDIKINKLSKYANKIHKFLATESKPYLFTQKS